MILSVHYAEAEHLRYIVVQYNKEHQNIGKAHRKTTWHIQINVQYLLSIS